MEQHIQHVESVFTLLLETLEKQFDVLHRSQHFFGRSGTRTAVAHHAKEAIQNILTRIDFIESEMTEEIQQQANDVLDIARNAKNTDFTDGTIIASLNEEEQRMLDEVTARLAPLKERAQALKFRIENNMQR